MNNALVRPLTMVKIGQRGVVVALVGGAECQHRLVCLGLHIGQEVRVLCGGDGCGGPTLVAAGEARLAVGQGMAGKVMVASEDGGMEQVDSVPSCDVTAHRNRGRVTKKTGHQSYRRRELHEEAYNKRGDDMDKALRLSDYAKGQKGRVMKVQGNDESRRRLSEMGFIRGIEVEVVKAAPLTDPVEYLVKGYHVSLRREQAAEILMDLPIKEELRHE